MESALSERESWTNRTLSPLREARNSTEESPSSELSGWIVVLTE